MSHDHHEAHPDYSPDQILHPGCAACAWTGDEASRAIESLDGPTFIRAWERAVKWQREGLPDLAEAEVYLLLALRMTAVQFERLGLPLGQLPAAAVVVGS